MPKYYINYGLKQSLNKVIEADVYRVEGEFVNFYRGADGYLVNIVAAVKASEIQTITREDAIIDQSQSS